MRDAILFLIVFGSIPFIFKRPAFGIMMFCWISLMNPHRLCYGAAYDFPFAALICCVIFASLITNRGKRDIPMTPAIVMLLVFCLWMNVTTLFAQDSVRAWVEWNRVMKTMFMIMLGIAVLRSASDIKLMAWVVGLSLGFWGLKGGIFTIKSGGTSHVFGPDNSYIGDNNALALALITALPIIWYLRTQTRSRWIMIGMSVLAGLTLVSSAGSYSRGALLAGGVMLGFLWLKSRTKIRTGIALALLVPLIYTLMPAEWSGRMNTIDNYQEDESALGRINAWGFAFNVAKSNVFGGGFDTFTHAMFARYAPNPLDHHAAHSIYFQVLGEHGFIGLILFLLFFFLSWRIGSRVIRKCGERPELKWARELAAMSQVSLIGYLVGGAFLTLAYYDLPYYVVSLLVVLERYVSQPGLEAVLAAEAAAQAAAADQKARKRHGTRLTGASR